MGKNMSYKEIDGFEKGEEIKMQIDKGNLPTTQLLTDTLPIFPSGEKEMLRFIYTNIKYPAEARQKGIQGDLTAQFIVEKDGSISNLKIKNDLGGGLKEEVLRVMKLVQEMPEKWTPAMTNGVVTRSTYELPFEYRLEGQNKDGAWRSKNDPATVKEGRSIVIVGRYNSTTEEAKKTDDKDINLPINPIIKNKSINGEPVYKIADENPRFPGCGTAKEYNAKLKNCGDEKMLQFIYKNINYPKAARAQGIEGTVVVRFIVKKDGSLSDEKILRNIGGGTGEEALRVVNLMKEKNIRWVPGIIDGQPVNFNFNLPIKFRLDADAKKEIKDLEKEGEKTEKLQQNIENLKKQNAELQPAQYKETTTTKKIAEQNIIYHPDAPKIPIGYIGEAVTFKAGLETLTLNVFPNPIRQRERLSITLQGEANDILVTVFDFAGKEFFREEVAAFDGVIHRTIDLQNALAGTLIVNIRHKGKDYQKKVIVQ